MQANPELIMLHEGFSDLILFMFFLANILLIRQVVSENKDKNPSELLWNIIYTGAAGVTVMFVTKRVLSYYRETPAELFTAPLESAIAMYALIVFLFTAIYTFRKFIFYLNSRIKFRVWQLFEIIMLLGLGIIFENPFYFIDEWMKLLLLVVSFGLILYFCTNTRWVAYLTLRQKLTSIALLLGIIVVLFVFIYEEDLFSYSLSSLIHEFFFYRFFVLGVAALFIAIYAIFSILVLIFNLPTGSVFEQTRTDLVAIQKIQQSIIPGLAKEGAVRTLLDAALLSANASCGWVEMEGEDKMALFSNISEVQADMLKQDVNLRRLVLDSRQSFQIPDLHKLHSLRVRDFRFRSLLVLPIQTRFTDLGALFLVQDISFGFNEDNIQVLKSFADQAALALENITLTEKSLEIERYKEQITIARQMQEKLYPAEFPASASLRVFAKNQQAEEVGGDYYDIIQTGEGKYKVVIGDVSGKGTTAAFYMAEVKGMFHALAQTDVEPRQFVSMINQALSYCMDKGSFITLTYLYLDIPAGKAWLVRAGHCPSLYYSEEKKDLLWMIEGGLALGVLKGTQFDKHVRVQEINIRPGDRFILFTDGIVEARNESSEEYEYDRLMAAAQAGTHLNPEELSESIIREVRNFSGGYIEDDYTLMIIDILRNPESATDV